MYQTESLCNILSNNVSNASFDNEGQMLVLPKDNTNRNLYQSVLASFYDYLNLYDTFNEKEICPEYLFIAKKIVRDFNKLDLMEKIAKYENERLHFNRSSDTKELGFEEEKQAIYEKAVYMEYYYGDVCNKDALTKLYNKVGDYEQEEIYKNEAEKFEIGPTFKLFSMDVDSLANVQDKAKKI